jgi:hypothetical protein
LVTYATESELRTRVKQENRRVIVEKAEYRSPSGSTFLSHSSKDADILPGAVSLLEEHGASVYVDKIDTSLPPITSRNTASILKGRIQECKKFVLLASIKSKESKWMPWELGIADGYKKPRNVAILPALEKVGDRAWSEQEYLGIYDRIVWGKLSGFSRDVWMVWDDETNTATELSKWLAQ